VRTLPFGPGESCVFVANDWHSALVPLLLKVCAPGDLQEQGVCLPRQHLQASVSPAPPASGTRGALASLSTHHPSLCPPLPHVQDEYQPRGQFKGAKTAFVIHNIAFQVRRHCPRAGGVAAATMLLQGVQRAQGWAHR
jgi:hypothetical protein